jgi:Xaa-Pro aminopeptidase
MNYAGRQQRLSETLHRHGVTAMLITHLPNVRYLCGFTGSAGVLAIVATSTSSTQLKMAFFTDGRYTEQAKEQVSGAKVVIAKGAAMAAAAEWLSAVQKPPRLVGFEADHMSVATRAALGTTVNGKLQLRGLSSIVEKLRMIKEPVEIERIRAAIVLASSVFEAVLPDIKPGITEANVAAQIEYMCRRLGAEGMSFDTLVAAGRRSALPHGVASQNLLPAKGFVIIDFGVILAGYCSDMTRTVHLGSPDKAALRMYKAVQEAQLAGIAAVGPGVETDKVDYAARKVLEKSGLGRYFTHSTGHGVGIEIHEPPSLRKSAAKSAKLLKRVPTRQRSKSPGSDRLEPGMVVTIEPGVYMPGKGGVRIEDVVLVTESGCEVLTPTRKDLLVL